MFWMTSLVHRTCVWHRGYRGRDISSVCRDLHTPYVSRSRHSARLSRPVTKILITSHNPVQSLSLFEQRSERVLLSTEHLQSRVLKIFKLKTPRKLLPKRLACGVGIKVATTRRFVATYMHRVYPGRDSPPVCRDSCAK